MPFSKELKLRKRALLLLHKSSFFSELDLIFVSLSWVSLSSGQCEGWVNDYVLLNNSSTFLCSLTKHKRLPKVHVEHFVTDSFAEHTPMPDLSHSFS